MDSHAAATRDRQDVQRPTEGLPQGRPALFLESRHDLIALQRSHAA